MRGQHLAGLPQVSGVDFCYDEAGVVPGWSRESGEETQHDDNKYLRVDDVEKEHRGSGGEEAEG